MQPVLAESDREFLLILRQLNSATVPQLCSAMEVTATAVRQRLARLQDWGLVERVTIRHGRGRPHHQYCLSESGKAAFGNNYGELAMLLWSELQKIPNTEVREHVLSQLRSKFVNRMGGHVPENTLDERLNDLQNRLESRGFSVEVERRQDGTTVIREHHCPYHDLAVADPAVCAFEQQVFEQVLGHPLQLIQSCRSGAACCEFQMVSDQEISE